MITISGYSDDLVEVDGAIREEYTTERWQADLIAPDGQQARVHCWYDDDGCWQVGIGQTDEDHQLPDWLVTIRQQRRRDGSDGYSLALDIDAPDGAVLANIKEN